MLEDLLPTVHKEMDDSAKGPFERFTLQIEHLNSVTNITMP